MFDGRKIELPKFCTKVLKDFELLNVVMKAGEYVDCWKSAGAAPDSTFDDLPFLDSTMFATFYKSVVKALKTQPNELTAFEVDAKKDAALRAVVWENADRKKVGWLEFWVYQCAGGIHPPQEIVWRKSESDKTNLEKMMEINLQAKKALDTKAALDNQTPDKTTPTPTNTVATPVKTNTTKFF